jgi:hypothetical protein
LPQVKQWVASRNVAFKTEDVKFLQAEIQWNGRKRMLSSAWSCEKNRKRILVNGITELQVDRLIISLEGNASDTSDMEVEDYVESDYHSSRIEDLA